MPAARNGDLAAWAKAVEPPSLQVPPCAGHRSPTEPWTTVTLSLVKPPGGHLPAP